MKMNTIETEADGLRTNSAKSDDDSGVIRRSSGWIADLLSNNLRQ